MEEYRVMLTKSVDADADTALRALRLLRRTTLPVYEAGWFDIHGDTRYEIQFRKFDDAIIHVISVFEGFQSDITDQSYTFFGSQFPSYLRRYFISASAR